MTSGDPLELRGRALDAIGSFWWPASDFDVFPGEIVPHFGVPVGSQNLKVAKKHDRAASRTQPRKKSGSRTSPKRQNVDVI